MSSLSQEQINQIVEELDCGLFCYFNKETSELIFLPDPESYDDIEMEDWEDDLKKVKKNHNKIQIIEPPSSIESYEFMSEFVRSLENTNPLKKHLTEALKKKHPFQGFGNLIHSSGAYREEWFIFKNKKLQDHVKNELAHANSGD